MIKQKVILFDIDFTIFDTAKFRDLTESQVINLTGISAQKILQIREAYYKEIKAPRNFHPVKYFQALKNKVNSNVPLEKIWNLEELYEQSLFPETTAVLESLKRKYTLGIFSEGYKFFQKKKIKPSGISQSIDKNYIFIFRSKTRLGNLKLLPNKSIIVDDKKEVVEKIAKDSNHIPIWINRKNSDQHPKIITIFSLNELEKAIT